MVPHPDQALFAKPLPPGVDVDRSGGRRAHVTNHALRRFCERACGLGDERLAGIADPDALDELAALGFDLAAIEVVLAYYGGVAMHRGAPVVRLGNGAGLVVTNNTVVTVIAKDQVRTRAGRRRPPKQHWREK